MILIIDPGTHKTDRDRLDIDVSSCDQTPIQSLANRFYNSDIYEFETLWLPADRCHLPVLFKPLARHFYYLASSLTGAAKSILIPVSSVPCPHMQV